MMNCLACKAELRPGLRFCTQCGVRLAEEREAKARLIMLSNTSSQSEFELKQRHCYLGRHINNHVVLDDDRISKRHAEIWWNEDAYWIKDLGSRNGVTVNGQVIDGQRKLLNGNLIKLGFTILRFEEQ